MKRLDPGIELRCLDDDGRPYLEFRNGTLALQTMLGPAVELRVDEDGRLKVVHELIIAYPRDDADSP